jgi:glyoxylase-like metal-dependent hydrolase (beta-lactamase superfamily II)
VPRGAEAQPDNVVTADSPERPGRCAAGGGGSRSVKLGPLDLLVLDTGTFVYDGGAMFGVVPKVIWSELMTPDEENRIPLSLRLLLITTPESKILVDTGFGSRFGKREARAYGPRPTPDVEAALAAHGVDPAAIDVVVLTHLHADHAGGATKTTPAGVIPAFPNARYLVHELEWNDALRPNAMSAAAYRTDDFLPLSEAGQLEFVGDEHDLGHGVTVLRTGGHTAGHLMVLVETPEGTVVYPADLIPTRHHVRVPYVASVDLYPLDVVRWKETLLRDAVRGNWHLILDHDPGEPIGRVVETAPGRYGFVEVEDLT